MTIKETLFVSLVGGTIAALALYGVAITLNLPFWEVLKFGVIGLIF